MGKWRTAVAVVLVVVLVGFLGGCELLGLDDDNGNGTDNGSENGDDTENGADADNGNGGDNGTDTDNGNGDQNGNDTENGTDTGSDLGAVDEDITGWGGSRFDQIAVARGTQRVTLDAARSGEQVYYVITNQGEMARDVTVPPVSSGASGSFLHRYGGDRIAPAASFGTTTTAVARDTRDQRYLMRGHPSIRDEYEKLERLLPRRNRVVSSGTDSLRGASRLAPSYSPGDQDQFFRFVWQDGDLRRSAGTIGAELKEIRIAGDWRALFWVAQGLEIDPTDLRDLADAFMKDGNSGDQDDIFRAVTNVFGMPWGEPGYINLIPQGERDLHVFLYDISAGGPDNIVVGGLFFPTDTFLNVENDEVSTSNERLMFYMNGAVLNDDEIANGRDYIWTTLAHEFQHMIQFYQRGVRRGSSALYGTWLDELASLMAEDLVAKKIDVTGPASIRMPDYNKEGALLRLTTWGQAEVGYYGTSYAFGAYLARVFGANYLRTLLQNIEVVGSDVFSRDISYSRWALAEAVRRSTGLDYSFGELLRRWGVAMMVSGDPAVPAAVRVNRGSESFRTTVGSIEYTLESINAYNYRFTYLDSDGESQEYIGPSFWNPGASAVPGAANRFVVAGTVPEGGASVDFALPGNVVVTVLTLAEAE